MSPGHDPKSDQVLMNLEVRTRRRTRITKRRRFTPEFKARVVLEVLAGGPSPAEACRKHALSPNLLTTWKSTFLERAHAIFQPDERHDEDRSRRVRRRGA